MQEIKRLLSYVREGGWAMVSKGSSVMVNEKGTTMLNALLEYNTWKENVDMQGFDEAFPKLVTKLRGKSHPCFCFEFLHFSGRIPDTMTCAECPRSVDKYSTFLSCQSTQGINSKHHAINKTTSQHFLLASQQQLYMCVGGNILNIEKKLINTNKNMIQNENRTDPNSNVIIPKQLVTCEPVGKTKTQMLRWP